MRGRPTRDPLIGVGWLVLAFGITALGVSIMVALGSPQHCLVLVRALAGVQPMIATLSVALALVLHSKSALSGSAGRSVVTTPPPIDGAC